jgi:hypothetical protein
VDCGDYTIYEIETWFSPGCKSTYWVSFFNDNVPLDWNATILDQSGIEIPEGNETVLSGTLTYIFSLRVTCPDTASGGEMAVITTNIRATDYYNQDEFKEVITTTTVNGADYAPNPVILSQDSATQTTINLTWTESDLILSEFDRYELHMSLVPIFTPVAGTKIATITDKGTTEFEVTGLSQETTYYFCVRVWDNDGAPGPYFADSNILEASTLGSNLPPTPVILNDPEDVSNCDANLTWSLNTDDDFDCYEIHVSTTPGFKPNETTLFGEELYDQATLKSLVTGLAENTTHYFKIRVYDTGGLFADSNEVNCETLDHDPQELLLDFPYDTTFNSTKLTWTQSNITDFHHYEVHVSETSMFTPSEGTKFTDLFNATENQINVTGLSEETKYYFVVRLVDISGRYTDTNYVYTTTMDSSLPSIIFTSPYDGEIGVDTTQAIIVVFSERMDVLSVQYSCSPDPGVWDHAWSNYDKTLTFLHNSFDTLTTYEFEITAAKDIHGNDLVNGDVPNPFSFVTNDAIPPTIISTTPADKKEDVSITSTITLTFSEAMDPASVENSLITTFSYNTATWEGNTLTITPSSDLDYSTEYIITVTKGAKDASGSFLTDDYSFGFSTEAEPEIPPDPVVNHPPTVIVTSPDNHEADDSFEILWVATDSDGDILTIIIYYDDDNDLTNGGLTLIESHLSDTGSYIWDTSGLSEGNVYIYIIANDGQTEAGSYSGMLKIARAEEPSGDESDDPENPNDDPGEVDLSINQKEDGTFPWMLLWIIVLITVTLLLVIMLYARNRRSHNSNDIECPSCMQLFTPFDITATSAECPHCGETIKLH